MGNGHVVGWMVLPLIDLGLLREEGTLTDGRSGWLLQDTVTVLSVPDMLWNDWAEVRGAGNSQHHGHGKRYWRHLLSYSKIWRNDGHFCSRSCRCTLTHTTHSRWLYSITALFLSHFVPFKLVPHLSLLFSVFVVGLLLLLFCFLVSLCCLICSLAGLGLAI